MGLALKIVSWVAVVLGVLAIIGSAEEAEPMYSLLGGGLYLLLGVLSLVYMDKYPYKK